MAWSWKVDFPSFCRFLGRCVDFRGDITPDTMIGLEQYVHECRLTTIPRMKIAAVNAKWASRLTMPRPIHLHAKPCGKTQILEGEFQNFEKF